MTAVDSGAQGTGVRHLLALGQCPRGAGSKEEASARAYSARELRASGFSVQEAPFSYSAFPGSYGAPIAGALLGLTLCGASALGILGKSGLWIAAFFTTGAAVTAFFSRAMLGDGVLDNRFLRRSGMNLVATRGMTKPRVWVVAHLDSKSQPIPSIVRVGGVVMLAIATVLGAIALVLTLGGFSTRMVWWAVAGLSAVGMLPVMASVVGKASDGAVDNASGAAAVLAAAAQVRGDSVGVLMTSAEELGLAGARAWSRDNPTGIALNCDGVDDNGSLVIMYNGSVPSDLIRAVHGASQRDVHVRRMPLGLLTDSTAFADRGWRTATVSYGSLATLRRIHTRHDSLKNLRGDQIDSVANILARAAEALAK